MGATGMGLMPRGWRARLQLTAAVVVILLTFAGTAAARLHGVATDAVALTEPTASQAVEVAPVGAARASTVTHAERPAGAGFTLADLAAGRVSQAEQDRFWQAQLDAILAAPCRPATAGATPVTLFLGADEAWTERLSAATQEHAEACAAG